MISSRVRTSHARKNETTPITPSQSEMISRESCQDRLVVNGLDSSTETRSKASCSFFAVRFSPRSVSRLNVFIHGSYCQGGCASRRSILRSQMQFPSEENLF